MKYAETINTDLVLDQFLSFLALDLKKHPGNLKPLTASNRHCVAMLVDEIEIELDAPLSDEDECTA